MRNLKKLLAVVVAICVLATMTIPAFAAETKTDAQIAEALGVLKGDGAGVTDTYLAKGTNRYQAALLYLRLLGLEDEALAETSTENFEDAKLIYAAGQKVLAYLKANPDLGWKGVDAAGKNFEPTNPATAQSIYKVMLEALGYKQGTDFEWADVLTFAADKGLSKIADVTSLTNGDLAIAIVEALKAKVKGTETTLAAKLVADGIISEDAAAEAGLITLTPAELLVESVKADNLKEIVLTFNKEVDKDTVKTDNIKLKKDSVTVTGYSVSLNDDKKTVVIKAADGAGFVNQADYKVEIKDVKGADGVAIKAVTVDVKPFDATLPEVKAIKITGPKSFQIEFSEPIKDAGTRSISVKSGTTTIGVNSTFTGYNGNTITVNLYTSLTDGKTYTVAIKGFEDFADYKMINYSTDIAYVADKSEITATVEKAEQTYVVIKFNKPVKINGTAIDFFYHTFSAWKPLGVYTNEAMNAAVTSSTAVDKIYLKFADGTTGYPIAEGSTSLVIRDTANDKKIKDNWDNEFLGATLTLEVTADKTAPTVTELKCESETSLKVKFDENVKFEDKNVEVLNADGTKNKDINLSVSGSEKEYIINLGTNLAGKSVLVTLKNVEDKALSPNKMVTYTATVEITDKTAPSVSKITKKIVLNGEQAVYVFFSEEVGESALSKDNYYFVNGSTWKKVENDPAFFDGNKIVRIELKDAEKDYLSSGYGMTVMNVKDNAGNTLIAGIKANGEILAYDNASNAPLIEKVEAVATDKVEVTFDQFLADVDATAFAVNGATVSGMALSTNDKGNTVVTLTTADANKFLHDKTGSSVAITPTASAKVANVFGVNYAGGVTNAANIADKIAPAVKENGISTMDVDGDFKIDHIKIELEEDMAFNYVSPANFEVADYDVLDAYASTDAPTADNARPAGAGANSDVIYLRVKEKDNPDTAAKPGVKIKGTLKDVAGNDYKVKDDAISSIDKVAPKVTAAAVLADKKVTFTFSEAVYTNNTDPLTDVVIGDFTINDVSGTMGAPTFTLSSDKKTVTITFAGTVVASDNVVLNATAVYDAAGNAAATATATF